MKFTRWYWYYVQWRSEGRKRWITPGANQEGAAKRAAKTGVIRRHYRHLTTFVGGKIAVRPGRR